MIGKRIGNFCITGVIGVGGMGQVFAAKDMILERDVAVKVLRPELADDAGLTARFRSEAVTLAQLNHPHIATVYTFLQEQNQYFLVMELVRGWTLKAALEVCGALPLPVAIMLFRQALAGIGYAHQAGVVHRDIKPANLMLTEAGLVKVMDFGIARMLSAARLTRTGRLIGTLEYMSPEQIRDAEADARSDVYSLGILLYELVTGRTPFVADSDYQLMRAQIEQPPPLPREFKPELPAALERVLLRALAKAPEQRFQSADEFAAALATVAGTAQPVELRALIAELAASRPLVLAAHSASTTQPNTLSSKSLMGSTRRRVATGAALSASLLLGAGWWWLQPGATMPTPSVPTRNELAQPVVQAAPALAPAVAEADPPAEQASEPAPAWPLELVSVSEPKPPLAQAQPIAPSQEVAVVADEPIEPVEPSEPPDIDTLPPAQESDSLDSEVAVLLDKARAALADKRLLTPAQDSAVGWAQQVLVLDSTNAEASALLNEVLGQYLLWAGSQLSQGNLSKAAGNLRKAQSLERYASPQQLEQLASLQQELQAQRARMRTNERRRQRQEEQAAEPKTAQLPWYKRLDAKMQALGCKLDRKLGQECKQH